MAYITGKSTAECPFCHKLCINCFHKPSFRQASSSSSASAGKKTTLKRKDEEWIIYGDCPECKAKKKDIQAWYNGEVEMKKETKDERKKRLEAAGIPTVIEM